MKTRDSFPYIVEIKSTLSYRATKDVYSNFLARKSRKGRSTLPEGSL